MKKSIILILCILILTVSSTELFAGLPLEDQNKLWTDLVLTHKNPKISKFDKWNVIEGIELIKKIDDVRSIAAAVTTIIRYFDKKDKIWLGGPDFGKASKDWEEKKKPTKDEINQLREKGMKHINSLYDELEVTRKEYKGKYLTTGVNVSRLIEKYLKANKYDVTKMVKDFASKRGMDVEVVIRDNFKFEELVKLIDNKIPFIMQPSGTENYLVCVGYIRKGREDYLIASDLNKIIFEEVSHADFVLGKGEMAKKAREKSKEFDKQFGLAKKDMKFKVVENIKQGLELIDWETGRYKVYLIKEFKTTENSINEYYKSLMEK